MPLLSPVSPNRPVVVTESVSGTWHYHLSEPTNLSHGLCGAHTMLSHSPLELWGHVGHLRENYCARCAAMAQESVPAPESIIRTHSDLFMKSEAEYSLCEKYRYRLSRIWDATIPALMLIGLNPSTATEIDHDRTVARCVKYAMESGMGGLHMMNLFAWRDTKPENMMAAAEPIGRLNDSRLAQIAAVCPTRVAAWGNHGKYLNRAAQVELALGGLQCLWITGTGAPNHPLYLPSPYILRPFNESSRTLAIFGHRLSKMDGCFPELKPLIDSLLQHRTDGLPAAVDRHIVSLRGMATPIAVLGELHEFLAAA